MEEIKQDKRLYSVNDLTKELNISNVAIYKKLNRYRAYYQQFITYKKRTQYINAKGLEALKTNAHLTDNKILKPLPVEKPQIIKENENLRSELAYKDKRLEELHNKLEEEKDDHKQTLKDYLALMAQATKLKNELDELKKERITTKESEEPRVQEEQEPKEQSSKLKRIFNIIKE